MLANGKEVNYLMLNGEVFAKDLKLPRFYRFQQNYYYVNSYELSLDSNNRPVFTVQRTSDNYAITLHLHNYQKTLILQLIKSDNYLFGLAMCTATYTFKNTNGSGGTYGRDVSQLSWFKMDDFGGGTPI